MQWDVVQLRAYYASRLGQISANALSHPLRALWTPMPNERLVGLGFALPWLDRFGADADRTIAAMPAGQGAVRWPVTGPCASLLAFDEDLPFATSAIDRLLVVHALEHSENPRETLRELWRILAPNGRLVLVVPNRRGLWARFDHTPFGTGRPYSRGQLTQLLEEANFTPQRFGEALFFPPWRQRMLQRAWPLLERSGRRFMPYFAGVVVVEAQKKIMQGLPVTQRQSRRVFVPVLVPQGAARKRS